MSFIDKEITYKENLLSQSKKKIFIKYLMLKWQIQIELEDLYINKKNLLKSWQKAVELLIENFK